MAIFRSNARRARLAIIFQWVKLVFILASIYFIYPYLRYVLRMVGDDGGFLVVGSLIHDPRRSLFSGVQGLWNIASMIFFLMWFHGAYRNLQTRLNFSLSHPPGWTVWGWLVPILNLFRPYKMMREMFIMTGGLAGKDAPGGKSYRTGWLGWWWALCVIPVAAINFVLFAAFLYPPALGIGPEFLAEIILEICGLDNSYEPYGPSLVLMVSAIVLYLSQLVLTLMTVKLIGDYSRMEAALPGDLPENEPPAGTEGTEKPRYTYMCDDSGFDIARPPLL